MDPGFDLDLTVVGKLRALVAVWMGDTSMPTVTRTRQLKIDGPRDLVRAFPTWLRRSMFANVERPHTTTDRA